MDADKIHETIETHIRITGAAPIVVIDYLQIITPHSDRASDKQATDKAVLELKRMGRSAFSRTSRMQHRQPPPPITRVAPATLTADTLVSLHSLISA
ncbi:MAG: hypothetical protein LBU70_11155 [Chitinispirillales bacterium]|jgi:hypothetical protein|nr:hypothetical protein [Chitinispirillales bacterium]